MLVLIILTVVWAAVLVPPLVRNRREARPDNSVVSFRAQLSTLERATPGTSLRTVAPGSSFAPVAPAAMSLNEAKRRRRQVLVALLAATGFSFLLLVAVGGPATLVLFLALASALGAYVFALRQVQLRSLERLAKVRPLVPRHAPAPVLAMRRTASS
jgi:Flp pilus assembly protein TadB